MEKVMVYIRIRRLRRGAHVETTGLGKTANWPRQTGIVERVRASSVFVKWDGSFVSDEMFNVEVQEIQEP